MNIKLIYGLENIPLKKLDIVVVIDIFRSSSVICNCFKYNCKKLYVYNSKLDILKNKKSSSDLFCGEEFNLKIKYFDLGNSPLDYNKNISGKYIHYISGFGSKALLKSNSNNVFLVGLINLKYASFILNKYFKDKVVYLIIGGNKEVICMDDFICAGVLISNLNFDKLDSLSLCALNLILQYKDNLIELLYNCPSAKYLFKLGFKKDVDYCISNECEILPFKKGFEIIKFE